MVIWKAGIEQQTQRNTHGIINVRTKDPTPQQSYMTKNIALGT